jgi:DNA-binding NarL/FixJ family response regulator
MPDALKRLTPRELDVLRAIARGKSNSEVGAELYLSEPTVQLTSPISSPNPDLHDRVQAVVLAYEVGLVTPHTQ